MSNYIKNLVQTSGWKEVEGMFKEAILACKSEEVNENLDGDTYKTTALANIKAAKKIKQLLDKIKLAGRGLDDKNISYK